MTIDVMAKPHQLIASDRVEGTAVRRPNGDMIGMILLPETCANLCFGGPKRNRLYMAASQSLYSVYVETRGADGWSTNYFGIPANNPLRRQMSS